MDLERGVFHQVVWVPDGRRSEVHGAIGEWCLETVKV